jgi:PKD repeat protein
MKRGILTVTLLIIISAAQAQDVRSIITGFLSQKADSLQISPQDISGFTISDHYKSESSGLDYVYLQQNVNQIPVFNAITPVAIRNGKIISFANGFRSLSGMNPSISPQITPVAAIKAATSHLGLPANNSPEYISSDNALNLYRYEYPQITSEPVEVRLYYTFNEKGIHLCWNVLLVLKDGSHAWNIRIDAVNGSYIEKNDWVTACNFNHPQESNSSHDHDIHRLEDSGAGTPPPASVPAEYSVFALPGESPNHTTISTLTDPSHIIASPWGWHDTNGASGEEYTITRGNNTYTYEDANADNVPGYSPNGTASLLFNYPFHPDSSATYNRNASLTNLFYMNNIIHDILYQNGFTEAAGNFQFNNYGRGGLGNDAVNAEGLDGGGMNNANFFTPPDGSAPRMQMYMWNGGSCTTLNINSPPAIAGLKQIGVASWSNMSGPNITADVVYVNDGVSFANDGCETILNNISGKIALIDRGNCPYTTKVENAQLAGAAGVIIANHTAGTPPNMGGTPAFAITITAVQVSLSDGNAIKSQLSIPVTVNATIDPCLPGVRDGDFDNGVVAHEYGHGVSNRLTGGPSNASCLGNGEQGGEGWSDWLGLILTIEPGDSGAMVRGIGTFDLSQPVTGTGIRTYPYSTDMNINPHTYADLSTNSAVHYIGEVWCSAVWDMTWFLINDLGFNPNLYSGTAGNNIAMKLVLEGMKLQPCNPGFLDARDAILLADDILYNNAHRCLIWAAFARRGMGYYANQGSSGIAGDETEDFTIPPFCITAVNPPVADFTAIQTTVTCPQVVQFTDQSSEPQNWLWDFGDGTTSTQHNPTHIYYQAGTYNVTLIVTNTLGADTVIKNNFITVNSFQLTATATPAEICSDSSVQLSANVSNSNAVSGYTLTAISHAPENITGTIVSLADDEVSGSRPIGFNFRFYGNEYNSFYISSNGFITFSAGSPHGCCNGGTIPSATTPNNYIALGWNDLNPAASGTIRYSTTGVAPNRRLVVHYNLNHYNGTAFPFNMQCILYEGSNHIEIHTATIVSPSGGGNVTTQGIENLTGSSGVSVPGRNATNFSASNDAYRFIPFSILDHQWSPAASVADDTMAVTTATPSVTTLFTVTTTDANGCSVSAQANVTVIPRIIITSFSPASGSPGQTVTLSGSGFTGVSTVNFGSISTGNFSVVNDNTISVVVPSGAVSGTITAFSIQGCSGTSAGNFNVSSAQVILNLNVFLQGFYSQGNMVPVLYDRGLSTGATETDSITVELHDPLSPASVIYSSSSVLHSNGQSQITFPGAVAGNSFYIVIRHRNSLETWSKLPVTFGTVTNYDFTQ